MTVCWFPSMATSFTLSLSNYLFLSLSLSLSIYIYIYIGVHVLVRVCLWMWQKWHIKMRCFDSNLNQHSCLSTPKRCYTTEQCLWITIYIYFYIYIYILHGRIMVGVCVCVCVCVLEIFSQHPKTVFGLFLNRIYEEYHINLCKCSVYDYCYDVSSIRF